MSIKASLIVLGVVILLAISAILLNFIQNKSSTTLPNPTSIPTATPTPTSIPTPTPTQTLITSIPSPISATPTPTPTQTPTPTPISTPTLIPISDLTPTPTILQPTVIYSDSGFRPNTLTIQVGKTVVFKNQSGRDMWVASDSHPEHNIYPEFDAKRPYKNGENYAFTFAKKGVWKYHDHLAPFMQGVIVVE